MGSILCRSFKILKIRCATRRDNLSIRWLVYYLITNLTLITELPMFRPRTTDAQWSLFSLKSRTFGLGQTNWENRFWGIFGIFGQTVSTHFFHYLTIISTKTKPLCVHSPCFRHHRDGEGLKNYFLKIWARRSFLFCQNLVRHPPPASAIPASFHINYYA